MTNTLNINLDEWVEISESEWIKLPKTKSELNYFDGEHHYHFKKKEKEVYPKCKLCLEQQPIFMDGMCDICFEYSQKRIHRIGYNCYKQSFPESEKIEEKQEKEK
jgi:hypothetical protein